MGGRVITNANKMYHIIGKIADFDANSLDPSAMKEIIGLPLGKPIVLSEFQLNYKFLKTVSDY